jgi:hypothetical protein
VNWIKSLTTITPNYAVSPDGNTNASRVQFNGLGAQLYQAIGFQSPSVSSFYVKGTTGQTIAIYNSFNGGGLYELRTLTGQWQRIEVASVGSISSFIAISNFFGATATEVLVYGAQFELGSYATSYIPTTSASVTRNADVVSKTGISSLIGQTEGTVFVDFDFDGSGFGLTNDFFLYVGNGTNTDSIYIDYYNNIFRWVVFNGLTNVFYTDLATTNGRHKLALGYKAGQYVAYADGNLILANTNATAPPTCAMLSLAQNVTGFGNIAKNINASALWKTRLTNTQLAQLTTI